MLQSGIPSCVFVSCCRRAADAHGAERSVLVLECVADVCTERRALAHARELDLENALLVLYRGVGLVPLFYTGHRIILRSHIFMI